MRKFLLLPLAAALAAACDEQPKHECLPDGRIDNIERVIMRAENDISLLRRTNPADPNLLICSFNYGTTILLRTDLDSADPLWAERRLTGKSDWSCRYEVVIHLHNPQEVH